MRPYSLKLFVSAFILSLLLLAGMALMSADHALRSAFRAEPTPVSAVSAARTMATPPSTTEPAATPIAADVPEAPWFLKVGDGSAD